ncbi:MAG TPA: ankyrin repeat domain-containing protein [Rhodocyclaceae bacterium]|nr:ankyrin repeat domain-containing protein [Rhodocyclaceae bacterium]
MPRQLRRLLILLAAMAVPFPTFAGVYDDILVAARDNRADIVVDLVQRGMDSNTSDRSGTTLLMFAAVNGNDELVEFLLRSRANILKQNKYGDTAVGLAALVGNLPIVRRLVEAGADVATQGWNALHYAAFNGHVEVVQFLVSKGAALDMPAPNRQTALMFAARNGHLEVVKILVEADADMDMDDPEGNTALDIALKAGNSQIADYLRSEGAEE